MARVTLPHGEVIEEQNQAVLAYYLAEGYVVEDQAEDGTFVARVRPGFEVTLDEVEEAPATQPALDQPAEVTATEPAGEPNEPDVPAQ